MKRLLFVFILVLFVSNVFGAQIVKDSDFDFPDTVLLYGSEDVIGAWTTFNFWGAEIVTGVAGTSAKVFRNSGYGSGFGITPIWAMAACWQDTGEVFQANTVYTMTIRWYDSVDNDLINPDVESIGIQIQSIASGDIGVPWGILGTNVAEGWDSIPSALDVPQDFTMQFDTSTNPGVVGTNIGVSYYLTSATGVWTYIDSITLTYASAENPTPANDADTADDLDEAGVISGGLVDLTLEWDAAVGPNVTNHYVYLQENDPNFAGASPIATKAGGVTSHSVTGLNPASVYHWRIDEGVDGSAAGAVGTITGPVWAFETMSLKPVITDHPDDTLVAGGATVAMSVTATTDPSFPITDYDWFLSDDAVNDTPGDDTSMGSGNPSSFTAALADAGRFAYCRVTNTSGSTRSNVALMEVERLMGLWKLDGSLDSTPAGQLGVASKGAFVAGIDGSAREFIGNTDPNYVVVVAGTETSYNNMHLGLSVSMWVKTSFSGWQILAGKQDRDAGTGGWSLNLNPDGQVHLALGETAYSTASVNDDAWHLVTGTFDGAVTKYYIDGVFDSASTALATPIDRADLNTTQSLEIGGETATETVPAVALIDEVKVYNYPLHPSEVVDNYNDYAAVKLNRCVGDYASNFDTNGPSGVPDCKITIHDFADLALNYLTDGCHGIPGTYPCDM